MIAGIFGYQGSGKTTIGVVMARAIARELQATIYSNIEAPGVVTVTKLSEIPMDRLPKILLIDEAMFTIDSRLFSSGASVKFTRFLAYLRKNGCLLLYMTHHPSMIDLRLRQQTNFAILARSTPDRFVYRVVNMQTLVEGGLEALKVPGLFAMANYSTEEFPAPITIDDVAVLGRLQK